MSEKMKLVKNALVLFAITLVAGLFLGLVFEVTKEARGQQIIKKQQEADKAVFADADRFTQLEFDEDAVTEYLTENNLDETMVYIDGIETAEDASGTPLGYVIRVTSKEGYAGNISFFVGIQNDRTINSVSILSIAETAGLGMKAKEAEFIDQYANKNVDFFVYTKNNASEDNEIDVISGATITTNAVTNGVNAAIFTFDYLTGGGSGE